MKKSYIWSLPTRIFHWLFALFILIAFLSDDDKYLKLHAVAGYSILILLFFRVAWGYFGPKYSLFRDFPANIGEAKSFIKNIFTDKQKYIGHNPLASYVMITMLIVSFIVIVTGVLTYGIQDGKGIASFLNSSFFKKMKLFKEIHEFFANFLLILIAAHLGGIFMDSVLHKKNNTLNSIFTGYKTIENSEDIKISFFQKLFALFMLIVLVLFLLFSIYKPTNMLNSSIHKQIDYVALDTLFAKECGSCHILYPPNLLPKKSWELMMNNLENHFGDDASLDDDINEKILAFLVKNSSENSTTKASWKFTNSIKEKDIIALTKTNYWEKKHKNIPKSVFKHEKVKSVANCKACHSDIEKGLIEHENIKNISDFM